MSEAVLRLNNITKTFGSVTALGGVNFSLDHGEIHALLGTNGAGKSTLVKIISGLYTKDSGTIEVEGKEISLTSPADAIKNGIAVVQQHPELIDDLTGTENIYFGSEAGEGSSGLFSRVRSKRMKQDAQALLDRFPIDIDLDRPVSEMGAVDREIVAVLQALKNDNMRVLILDEPTSILTELEKASLYELMRTLKSRGISIIYITHHLEEVFEITDRLTVFRGGKNVVTMSSGDAQSDMNGLIEHLLGEAPGDLYPALATDAPGETVLELRNLTSAGAFQDISLSVSKGEILGIYGLVGSGLDELSKAIFGAHSVSSGQMLLNGSDVRFSSPADALKAGVFLVPGDRRQEGLTMSENVPFNTSLANLDRASRKGGLMKPLQVRRLSAEMAQDLELQPPLLHKKASEFSGGNQQKIVVAKGLYTEADLYIFAEPTVGVDIGAKAKIYSVIRELAKTDAVIVLSSDGDEVHGLADRLVSLYRGSIVFDAVNTPDARDRFLASGVMGSAAA